MQNFLIFTRYLFISLLLFCRQGKAQDIYFPELSGWKLSPEILHYTQSDLFNYIDGAADNFISYGFENLSVGEYQKDSLGIKAEIYCHSDTENGFGIYSSERFPDYNFMKIGGQAYTSQDILNMTCGKYYVKLFAETKSPEENKTLILLAHELAGQLDKNAELPVMLGYFPPDNKVNNSEQYINQGFLGYEFLSGAFTASYKDNSKDFKLFIIENSSVDEARKMLQSFLSFNNQIDEMVPGKLILIHDKYNGDVQVMLDGRYILGCLDLKQNDLADKYLREILAVIK